MTLVFGRDSFCRRCHGKDRDCAFCKGSGLTSGPQAPVRRDAAETSVAAAASIEPERLTWSRNVVLTMLRKRGPMTDAALYERPEVNLNMSESGARTRRSELTGMGKVADSGRRETLASGRKAIVWVAVND